jgi:DNA-binding NarL/FixJ family response regulator
MEIEQSRTMRGTLVLVFLGIAAASGVDLFLDHPSTLRSFHALYDVALSLGCAGAAAWLWLHWFAAEHANVALRHSLSERAAERDAWQRSAERALAGFGRALSEQFDGWGLTPTEREVALHLLKGKSHKEIAAATGRSERTVRQHAVAVYEKAGLDGRAALAGFFLDSVAVPPSGAPAGGPPPSR